MTKLSISDRKKLIMDIEQCLSLSEIAKKYSVSRGRVQQIKKEANLSFKSNSNGRPRLLNEREHRMIKRDIQTGNATTSTDVLKLHPELKISIDTVRRSLKTQGLYSASKIKKPLLTKIQKKKRLDFANAHISWTTSDWRQVVFSDESKINRNWSDGRRWCWKKKNSLDENSVSGTLKFGGGSIMVWGCITAEGPGYLTKIEGKMDAQLYCDILNDEFRQSCDYYGFDMGQIIFQQDNDPKHTSKKATKWLVENDVNVMQWPSQSPDLNPIEHIWVLLKRKLNQYHERPDGMLTLWSRISEEWERITRAECLAVIDSMPRRILALKKAKGGYIKY